MRKHDKPEDYHRIVHEKPAKILVTLNRDPGQTAAELSRRVEAQTSYTLKLVKQLEQHGFLTRETGGRAKPCHLTTKGRQVATGLTAIIDATSMEYTGRKKLRDQL